MRTIVGLGNPGKAYEGTRHNVGFRVVDLVAARCGAAFRGDFRRSRVARIRDLSAMVPGASAVDVCLLRPETFMNLSGEAVREFAGFYRVPPSDLLVVSDDANLPAGRLRLRRDGSAGGHNGLRSIIESLGTDAFNRLRIGVGASDGRPLSDHVLSRFRPEEKAAVEEGIAAAAAAAADFGAGTPFDQIMNTYNRAPGA